MAARGLENSILLCIDVFDKDPGPIDGIKTWIWWYTGVRLEGQYRRDAQALWTISMQTADIVSKHRLTATEQCLTVVANMLEISERCLSPGGAVQRGEYGVLVSEWSRYSSWLVERTMCLG